MGEPGQGLEYEMLKLQKSTDRNRTLSAYSRLLNIGWLAGKFKDPAYGVDGLLKIIKDTINANGQAIWVDIGSGNMVALRQAKLLLDQAGIDPSKLKSIGFDILPVDEQDLATHIKDFPHIYSPSLLEEKYRPQFVKANAEDILFPEPPDLITGVELLQWTDDPLKVFANASRQLKPGGIIGLSRTDGMYFTSNTNASSDPTKILREYDKRVFDYLFENDRQLGDFDKLAKSDSTFLLKKRQTKTTDYIYGLIKAAKGEYIQGFIHLYKPTPQRE